MNVSTSDQEHARDLDLERDLPTSPHDIEVLQRLRRRKEKGLLEHPEHLQPPFARDEALRSRPTFAGLDPFEL